MSDAQKPVADMGDDAMLQFKELTYSAIPEILPYLPLSGSRSCDYTIGGIYMWIDFFKYHYCIFHDTLFLKGVMEDNTSRMAFSLPLGSLPLSRSVDLLRRYCDKNGYRLEFSAIPEEQIGAFRELKPVEITTLDHWADYLYDAESMATFSGKKLSKKRNHVNKFMSLYPDAVCEPVTDGNLDAVKRCFAEICSVTADSAMAGYERRQVWHVLDNLASYDFESLCLKVGNEVAAFTFGEVINDTLHDHIEKALRRYDGSGETVFSKFVAQTRLKYPDVAYVNREDDAGDDGLRQSKLSYHPAFLLQKYNVIF